MEYETAVQYLCVLIMPLPKPSVITIAGQNLGTGRIAHHRKAKMVELVWIESDQQGLYPDCFYR